MSNYTEFYFRANVKDGPVADWLHSRINHLRSIGLRCDGHPFFDNPDAECVFWGQNAAYQEARQPVFRRKDQAICQWDNSIVIASSLHNYGNAIGQFIDWITPHLHHVTGEFLGYSLHEDSWPVDYPWGGEALQAPAVHREQPHLYFMRQS